MKIGRLFSLITTIGIFFQLSQSAHCSSSDRTAEYWRKVSQRPSPEFIRILNRRVNFEDPSSRFLEESLVYFAKLPLGHIYQTEAVRVLVARMSDSSEAIPAIKDNLNLLYNDHVKVGRHISLKRLLKSLLSDTEGSANKQVVHTFLGTKLFEVTLSLQHFPEAEAVFLKYLKEQSAQADFWELYTRIEFLINAGKLKPVAELIVKLQEVASKEADAQTGQAPWILLLESKMLLQMGKTAEAFAKAAEMKTAFASTSSSKSIYPAHVYAIISRRHGRIDLAIEAGDQVNKGLDGSQLLDAFWYRIGLLKTRIAESKASKDDLMKEVEAAFKPLQGSELESEFAVYKEIYSALVSRSARRLSLEKALGERLNYFEGQEALSLLPDSSTRTNS